LIAGVESDTTPKENIAMGLTGSQKLAVLLCKFSDSQNIQSQPEDFFRDLFAKRGTGGLNDYWIDASLGNINLDGTEIFGWKVLDQKRDDFVNARPSRWDKVQGAIEAFPTVDTSTFAGVVAVFNIGVGDAGTSGGVLAGPTDVNVTFLAHETGHVFGLEHSFDQSPRKRQTWSAPGEYWDRYDVMSAMNVASTQHPRFGRRGPLLNVGNLDRMGWLPSARVWKPTNGNSSTSYQFDLVSLGHPEIPGYLAAIVGDIYIEFRTQDGWDAGLSRPAVLLHHLIGDNTVILASNKTTWVNEWQAGQTYGPSDLEMMINGGTRITVESFDLSAKKARISVVRRATRPFVAGPAQIFGGVAQDGGGWIILPSGRRVPIPPRGPILAVLEQLASLVEAQESLQFSGRDELFSSMAINSMQALEGEMLDEKESRGV
jgi:hypothetical protein